MVIGKRVKHSSFNFVVIILLIAIAIGVFVWFRFLRISPDLTENIGLQQRPGAVYTPSATPVHKAIRPELSLKNKQPLINDKEGLESEKSLEEALDDDANEAFTDIEVPSFVIADDDPAILAMAHEADFSEAVWEALQHPSDVVQSEALSFLESEYPSDRAFGGVLLFATKALEGDAFDSIIEDVDPSVPLIVYDWIRDFGTDEEIEIFSDAIKTQEMSSEELLSYVQNSASLLGGGRSALDLWMSSFDDGAIPTDQLASVVTSEGVSYDVRSQALFKLLEPETKGQGLAALEKYSTSLTTESGEFLPHAVEKWRELSQVSNSDEEVEKIWDSEAAVVLYLAESGKGLEARDLANYLEYALRRDDPDCEPTIELGTWEFANEYLQATIPRRESLSKVEIDALDRIAVSLDRLVAYDPAFNPFEEVGENEEIPEEFFEEEEEDDDLEDDGDLEVEEDYDDLEDDDDLEVEEDDDLDDESLSEEDSDEESSNFEVEEDEGESLTDG